MLNYKTRYPDNTPAVRAEMPFGEARDDTFEDAQNGFPYQADWINDVLGVLQYVAIQGRVPPNNVPDTALSSEYAKGFFATYREGGYKSFDPETQVGVTYLSKGYSELVHDRVYNIDPPISGVDVRKSSSLRNGGVVFGSDHPDESIEVGFRREAYDVYTGATPLWVSRSMDLSGSSFWFHEYNPIAAVVFEGIPATATIQAINYVSESGVRGQPLSFQVEWVEGSGWTLVLAAALGVNSTIGYSTGRFYVDWDPS